MELRKRSKFQLKLAILSSMNKAPEEVDALIKEGADPYVTDYNERTLLHEAAFFGNIKVMEYLVDKYRLDVMAKDEYGNTPAHSAATVGQIDSIVWLAKHGANLHAENYGGETARDMFVDYGKGDLSEWNKKLPDINSETEEISVSYGDGDGEGEELPFKDVDRMPKP